LEGEKVKLQLRRQKIFTIVQKSPFYRPDPKIPCFALSFSGKDLKLAKLYGAALLRLGGNGEISGTGDYTVPQAWASALVAHPANIDGFIDMSRRVNDAFAVVLFERDAKQPADMRLDQNVALFDHVDYLVAKATLAVRLN
jgi:hypothetical protein